MKTSLIAATLAAVIALEAAAQPAAPPQPDPKDMDKAALEAEVATLRGFVNNAAIRSGTRAPGCTASEHRQFDFWLGEWDVGPTGSDSVVIAESTIKLGAQGCVVIENWRPFGGAHGYSLNSYNAGDQQWHQEWMDATGRHTPYRGAFNDKGVLRMERTDGPWPGVPVTRRTMSFEKIDDNTVRQWGEGYNPETEQWTVGFDLTYRRRPGTSAAGG